MAEKFVSIDQLVLKRQAWTYDGLPLASGENLKRGDIVGLVTADNKLKKSVQTVNDGSEEPIGVMVSDVDATSGDVNNVEVYVDGYFNEAFLILDSSWNNKKPELRSKALKHNLYFVEKVDL